MKKLLATTALVCAVGLSSQAQAQSMDYGTMQELFGEPVTTSANGSPQRASDVALDMTIISAEDIAKYPATEIPDILRHYAGVSVRKNTATEYSVGIRGYNNPMNERLLVLVNGRQVFEDYFGLVNWSAIPVELNEIRQIEVVRGPNTALFGFNATSGVVNIVTMNPLYDDIDTAEADYGTDDYGRISGVYTWQGDKFATRLSYGGMQVDENDNDINPLTVSNIRDESQAQNFAMDTALQLNESTQMRFEATASTVDENQLDSFYDGYERTAENKSLRVNLSSDTDYGIIEATVYKNTMDSDYRNSSNGPGIVFAFLNEVTVAQLSNTFKIGSDHTVRLAGEYRHNTTDHDVNLLAPLNGGNPVLGTTTLNFKSLSALWSWNVTDNLAFSAATRYDHVQSDFDGNILTAFGNPYSNADYNNRYDEFGYNLGLVYKLSDADTVRFTAAKGVDLASSFELGFQTTASWANPNLDTSDVHDFQLGYERKVSDINGFVKLSSFYQRINEIQGFAAGTTTAGLGDSHAFGGEVTVEGETDGGIRWGVNYSYSQIEDDIDQDRSSLDYEDQNSNHIVNAHVGYSPNEQWDYDLYASYQSEFDQLRGLGDVNTASTLFNVEPEVIVDARVAYKPIENLTLSVNGQGVLGDNEQSAYGVDVDSRFFARAKYEF